MRNSDILDSPDSSPRLYQFSALDAIAMIASIIVWGFMLVATIGNIINNGPIFSLLLIVVVGLMAPIRYFWQYYRWTKGANNKASLEGLAFLTRPIILIEAVVGIVLITIFWQDFALMLLCGIAILLIGVLKGIAVVRSIHRVERANSPKGRK